MSEIEQAFKTACIPGFWGEVNVTIRDGKPFIVKLTQTTQVDQKVKTYDRSEAR